MKFPLQRKPGSNTNIFSPTETSLTKQDETFTEEETENQTLHLGLHGTLPQKVAVSWVPLHCIYIIYWGPRRCLSLGA